MLAAQTQPESAISASLKRSIHKHSGLFLAEGLVIGLLGVLAIALPLVAGLTTTVVLGGLMLVAGAVGLGASLRGRSAPGFGWALISSLMALVVGIVLLWNPVQGLVTLTFVMTAYFIADGIFMIGLAISHRRELSGRWEWLLINGLVDILLAGIVISGMPGTLVWALGLLVGIDLIFGAAALVALALDARSGKSA